MDSKVLIIIPTYNERENVPNLIKEIHGLVPFAHILIVDDNSPDKTGDIVEEISRRDERVRLMRRPGKMGLGTAYIAGFKFALANGYDLILEMDADFSHNPEYLPKFLEAAKDADLVLGSRYIPGGGSVNWSPLRKMISMGGGLYSRTLLGVPYRDLTGVFKCFRRATLAALALDDVHSEGYSFQIEMTYRVHKKGLRIREIPIIFAERREGASKMSWKIFFEAFVRVWQIRLTVK